MKEEILNYKYEAIDNSILMPYYRVITEFLINYIPLYISPNIITLTGLLSILTSSFIAIFLKDYLGLFLTCFICSFLLFVYIIMDTLDGSQCKRVNMYYNPTTEIFDHGCDSIVTCCVLYNLLYLSDNINKNYIISLYLALCIMFNFYLATWQHSNTKIMIYRSGILNPTESIFFIKLLFIFISSFSNIVSNIYIISLFLLLMVIITIYHFYVSVKDTFLNTKKKYIYTISSLFPLLLSLIYTIYTTYYYSNNVYYLNITIPLLISILNLIWFEITNTFDIISILLSFILNFYNFNLGIILSFGIYIYLFRKYINTLCLILNMKHFYSIN